MASLFHRLKRVLAPELVLERELAGGGMGDVFVALDPVLRRRVAVKLLRPDLATATAAARFLKEARLLARLAHPNVVTVFWAAERDGLFFYVMEYVEGETLATRLATQGALDAPTLRLLASDLLAGLDAVHRAGIVHRDLKPSNILLREGRALIADFGIALADRTTTSDEPVSHREGTPDYMSPEQRRNEPATRRSDLYSLGLVLFEAATGRPRTPVEPLVQGELAGIEPGIARAIEGALAIDPTERWANARAMAGAVAPRRRWPGVTAAGLGIAALGLLVWRGIRSPEPAPPGVLTVYVTPDRGADSLGRLLADRLIGILDLRVIRKPVRTAITITPSFNRFGDSIEALARLTGPPIARDTTVTVSLPITSSWNARVDSLHDQVVVALYQITGDRWLPRRALPKSRPGSEAWRRAERAYEEAEWERARDLYEEALRIDSTCLLCMYRLNDVNRWLGPGPSPELTDRLLRNIDSFPPHYKSLIWANAHRWPARYDTLSALAEGNSTFPLGEFALGDELFHRAALHGRRQSQALEYLGNTTRLKPRFTPGWEHLLWASLAQGDSANAETALTRLEELSSQEEHPPAGLVQGIRDALRLGFMCQFRWPKCQSTVRSLASDSAVRALPQAGAGPRILMSMGAPEGAIELGLALARNTPADNAHQPPIELRRFRASVLLGAMFGATAAGQLRRADSIRQRLRRSDSRDALFLAEWEIVMADLGVESNPGPDADQALRWRASESSKPSVARDRARWTRMIAGLESIDTLRVASHQLRLALQAEALARTGDTEGALRLTDPLTDSLSLEDPGPPVDPFLPTWLRVHRATWLTTPGSRADATEELRSNHHLQLQGYPLDEPQAGEVDWAFGPYLEERRAQLLETSGSDPAELCSIYLRLARVWRAGEGPARLERDSALARSRRLGCPP